MSVKMILNDKRFWPLFWTQFLGALNDNFLKNALIVLVTFKGVELAGMGSGSLVALASGLFILPFFLFSPIAGIMADKFEKSKLVLATKIWEVAIMVVAGIGFYTHSYSLLLFVLFLAGIQAALFGPVKYSLLPDLVTREELVEANAYVELGTFLAILIGTIAGGIVVSLPGGDFYLICGLMVLSILGLISSYYVQAGKPAAPELKLEFNPFPLVATSIRLLKKNKAIFNSVLAISWFWFFGAAILSVLPVYCKEYLGVGEHVVTSFLACFTIGIGLGSVICEKLSFKRVEIGLVPIGSIGMTIFILDLFFARPSWTADPNQLLSLSQFLNTDVGPRLLFDFLMMSVFGGFFMLPLYTFIQDRSEPESRSRVIAGNNVMNAIFMVASSIMIILFQSLKLSYPQMFLILAVMNFSVAVYIYFKIPEFTLRFLSWVLARTLYRLRIRGEINVPEKGPAVLVCNHVSFVDWLILSAMIKRPVRFVMYYKFLEIPFLKYLCKQAKVIPIAGAKEDPKLLAEAFDKIAATLEDNEIVCIFPEGQISRTGELNEFKTGIEKIIARNPVPVVPMALIGMAETFFGYSGGKALFRAPKHWMKKISLVIDVPIPASRVSAVGLQEKVKSLSGG
jgi:1-acyl-sn-glycerol-3-phosphate acyltransferase